MLMPSAERLDGFAVRFSAATGPAMKLTLVESLTPPQVAVMVAEPRLVGLVKVAVAFPLAVVVAPERVPAVVEKVTVVPSPMFLPLVSLTVAVIMVLEAPSATISELPAVIVTEPTEPGPPPAAPINARVIAEAEVTPPADALIATVSAAELMSVTSQLTVPSAPVEEVRGSIATSPKFKE